MQAYRRLIALFLCALVLLFSATQFTVSRKTMDLVSRETGNAAFESSNIGHFFLPQDKPATQGSQAWKSEVSIPGFFLQNSDYSLFRGLKIVRKIFVVNTGFSFSCKALFLFPFHEFL
jgi:hypothetical protein